MAVTKTANITTTTKLTKKAQGKEEERSTDNINSESSWGSTCGIRNKNDRTKN